jgi:hypothetical protein
MTGSMERTTANPGEANRLIKNMRVGIPAGARAGRYQEKGEVKRC